MIEDSFHEETEETKECWEGTAVALFNRRCQRALRYAYQRLNQRFMIMKVLDQAFLKVKRSLQSCLSIRMKEESEEGIGRL
jgi:hypothetical protein